MQVLLCLSVSFVLLTAGIVAARVFDCIKRAAVDQIAQMLLIEFDRRHVCTGEGR